MTTPVSPTRRPKTWRWVLLGLVVLFLIGAAASWVFRIPIASALIQRECGARDLTCVFEITELQTSQIVFENLSVRHRPGPEPIQANRIDLALAWTGLTPRVEAIEASGTHLSAEFDGSSFSLGGLEELFRGGGNTAATPPRITARNGRLDLVTPAGTVRGDFDVVLQSLDDGRLQATLDPVDLSTENGQFLLNGADLDLSLQSGRLAGVADIDLASGAFDGFAADSVLLRAEVAPSGNMSGDALVYRLAARRLSAGPLDITAATSNGSLIIDTDAIQEGALLSGLRLASGTFVADALRAPGLLADSLEIDLDLEGSEAGTLNGPLALTTQTAGVIGLASSGDLALSGDLSRSADGRIVFDGQVTAKAAALDPGQLTRLEGPLSWSSPATKHGDALATAFQNALTDFDTGGRVNLNLSPGGRFELSASGPTRLVARSGMSIAIRPFSDGPWLQLRGEDFTVRGAVALAGGGAPELTAQVNEFSLIDGAVSVRLGESELEDWRVGETELGASFSRLETTRTPSRVSVSGQGSLRFEGDLGGARFTDLNLFGDVDAVRGAEGWRAQLGSGRCLSLAFDSAQAQSFRLGRLSTSLCPTDGRIARQENDGSSGVLRLDAIALPFSVGSTFGELRLPSSELDWTLGASASTRLDLPKFTMDLTTGPRELELQAGGSDIGLQVAENAIEISGRLRNVDFGGSLIPANARAEGFDFSLESGSSGLIGTGDISGLRVSDYRNDPIYNPVLVNLSGELRGGDVHLTGPVRLEADGRKVADTDIRISFPAVDGMITVTGRELVFRPGSLQPTDLSERLRGFFTDTRGTLDAEARIAIDRGNLSGTGDVTAHDFSFQTVALGRVTGVEGAVFFSDLLELQSPPGQTVTIASIDPGFPLGGGTVKFQLSGGGSAQLESALWPFAGGVLAVEPTRWDIGAPRRRLVVRADRIGLSQLSELLQLPGFDAEGTVSGRFPILFQAGEVLVQNARLTADRRGGVLRYTGEVGEQAGATNENVATAFRALENFEFTVLELGADGDLLGDVVVTARLEGRNPDVLDGSPFNFNVSVDSELGQILTTARRLSGPDWLAEVRAEQAPSGGQ